MKNKETHNPNMDLKVMEEPMIFYDDYGTPLKSPMIFYNGPLNSDYPLPPIPTLGKEYYKNLFSYDKAEQKSKPPLMVKAHIVTGTESTSNIQTTNAKKNSKKGKEGDNSETVTISAQYALVQEFLQKKSVRIVNEVIFMYFDNSYYEISFINLKRELFDCLRNKLKYYPSSYVDSVANLMLKEKRICFKQKDISKEYIAFNNCLLNIATGQCLPHTPNIFTTYKIEADYYKYESPTPLFDNFLWESTGGDRVLIERIWQMIGYILTPDVSAKKYFLLQGVRDSGKSVLVRVLEGLFNDDAVTGLDISEYGQRFSMASIIGKALCTSADMEGKIIDLTSASKIKQLTGNDTTTTDVKYGKREKFVCSAKLIFATNHPFRVSVPDPAFFSRCVAIPFYYSIPNEKKDVHLDIKLLQERNGIVFKAIAAYRRLVARNYVFEGHYSKDEIFAMDADDKETYQTSISKFAKYYFTNDENGIVFIEDAHQLFLQKYGYAPLNDFSYLFQEFVRENYNAQKARKRKAGNPNAQSCILGISLKERC